MTIGLADIKYRKSAVVSDAVSNGGVKGQVEVISGVRHSLFPRVTKTERLAGLTRYRKEFWCNENADNDTAYGVLQWLEYPSNAGDIFYLMKGTQRNTQLDLISPTDGTVPLFTGVGTLSTLLAGGETSISIEMEDDDFYFGCGDFLHISNKIRTSQTIASNVVVGDSVTFSSTTWNRITSVNDITYPNGIYLGDNKVLTSEVGTHEEWLEIADNLTSDEVIGAGDGTTATIELTTLTNVTKGICQSLDKLPVVSTLSTAVEAMVAYIRQDGTVDTALSDASAGELNMETGVWTTDITWTTDVKDLEPIVVTYHENAFSYVGNVVTVELENAVSNSYAVANSSVSGCVYEDEVTASFDSWVKTSTAGNYAYETLGNVTIHNKGAVEDDITITFTSGTLFSISGARTGVIGTGFSVASNCSPTHPITGFPMFTLLAAGWSGTFVSGDSITFTIHPAAVPIWLKEVIPSATVQEPNNLVVLGWYSE